MQSEPFDTDDDVHPRRLRPEYGDTHYIVHMFDEKSHLGYAYKSREKREAEQEAFLALRDRTPHKVTDIEIIPRDDHTEMHHPDGTYAVVYHPEVTENAD